MHFLQLEELNAGLLHHEILHGQSLRDALAAHGPDKHVPGGFTNLQKDPILGWWQNPGSPVEWCLFLTG